MPSDQDIRPVDAISEATALPDSPRDLRERRRRLGPLVRMVPVERPLGGRIYAALIAAGAAALLVVAIALPPNPAGMGTHRQLGLPPCGMVTMTGLPCPTCGMTTAFAWTVRGHFGAAIHAQIAGFIAAVGTVVTFILAIGCVITGYRPEANWYRIDSMRLVWLTSALIVLAWGLKIAWGLLDGSLPAR